LEDYSNIARYIEERDSIARQQALAAVRDYNELITHPKGKEETLAKGSISLLPFLFQKRKEREI
jgi:hypothetical protein